MAGAGDQSGGHWHSQDLLSTRLLLKCNEAICFRGQTQLAGHPERPKYLGSDGLIPSNCLFSPKLKTQTHATRDCATRIDGMIAAAMQHRCPSSRASEILQMSRPQLIILCIRDSCCIYQGNLAANLETKLDCSACSQ